MDLFSFHNVLFETILQLIIYFPLGYLTIGKKIKNQPIVIQILISIIFGLPILTLTLSLICIFYIGIESSILIIVISYGILTYSLVRDFRKSKLKKGSLFIKLSNHDYLIIIIFVFSVFIFSAITSHLGWAPGVDSLNHGMLTSILLDNQKITSTLEPVAPSQPWFEPFGFHMISAKISLLMDLYPGQSILLFSSVISILLVTCCFTIVYYNSKSIVLSLVALLSCFFIFSNVNDIRFLEKWFLGFFYNTPYANLFGYYFLILFFFIYFVMSDLRKDHPKTAKLGILLSLIGILFSYSPFLVFPLGYIIIKRILREFERHSIAKRVFNRIIPQFTKIQYKGRTLKIINFTIILVFIISLLLVSNYLIEQFQDSNNNFFTLLNRIKSNSYFYTSVVLNPSSFTDISGYWTVALLIASIISIVKNNRVQLSYFYLTISSILTLSSFTFGFLNELLWFMLGGRLFVFMILLNSVITSLFIFDFTKWLTNTKRLHLADAAVKFTVTKYLQIILSFIIIVGLIIPSLVSNVSLEQASYWGWQVVQNDFRDDYKLFDWISNNVNETDLILTDYTYTTKKLLSFSLHNITSIPIAIFPQEIELGKDTAIVWEKPTLLKSFVDRYNVKYVLLDSDYNRRIPAELGGTDENIPKVYNSTEYKAIFSNMPFLSQIKEFGNSSLYRVIN